MADAATTSYDEIPYLSAPLPYTHPDRMASWARLTGITAPSLVGARVLELGCATGGNLVPMALSFPKTTFVGVDLSATQIAAAQETIADLRLGNIEVSARSIMDVDARFGVFDYIICHGVYSWVPPEVQDKILSVCKANLAPDGLAYVSYNTNPGWHLRGMVRDMMYYHSKQFDDPQTKVRQARAFLDFLADTGKKATNVYRQLLQAEADLLRPTADHYIFHEHLEEYNQPVYFHEFMARAAAKGLQYVRESQHSTPSDLPSEERLNTVLAISTDPIQFEQYLDFLRCRVFRRTILCHDAVPVRRKPAPEDLFSLRLVAHARPNSESPDLSSDAPEKFTSQDDVTATTNNPMLKIALVTLYEHYPQSLAFESLADLVRSRLAEQEATKSLAGEFTLASFAALMLQCVVTSLVELQLESAPFVVTVTDRPVACPVSRREAALGLEKVTTRHHRQIIVNDMERLLLRSLDGRLNRDELVFEVLRLAEEAGLELEYKGEPIRDREKLHPLVAGLVCEMLNRFARSAVLIA